MAPGDSQASRSSAEQNPGRPPTIPPRNFLAAKEQRRLFWRLIPPAVVVLLALEWLTRSGGSPSDKPTEPLIDTRIEAIAGPPPEPGTVVIESQGPFDPAAGAEALAASAEALSRVRDVAFFRRADHAAWQEIFSTLRSRGAVGADGQPPREVSFGELLGMPESFRGRPVRLRGTLHRLEELAAPADAAEVGRYWQGWLEPAAGPAAPVIIHLLMVPDGMQRGLQIHEPVVIDGYFLKTAAYRATDGVRVAPLILANEPRRLPVRATRADGFWTRSLGLLAAGTMLAVVAALGLGFLAAGRGRRRPSAPSDFDATLAGFEPVTVAEALRRAAVADKGDSDGDSA